MILHFSHNFLTSTSSYNFEHKTGIFLLHAFRGADYGAKFDINRPRDESGQPEYQVLIDEDQNGQDVA